MLPGEEETRRILREEYAEDFQVAREILELASRVLGSLCADEPRRFGHLAKTLCVAGFTKLCKHYRSIHALCELGLTQDAGILLRTMFEAFLRVEFLLCRKPPALGRSAPKDRLTVSFRAKLYVLEDAIRLEKYVRMLKGNAELRSHGAQLEVESGQRLTEASTLVGQGWMDWLRNRTMFGLSTADMARELGWDDWYVGLYRWESRGVHASDFEQHLASDEHGMITPTLYPDTETTTLPIRMANELLLATSDLVNERFRLCYGEPIAQLRDSLQNNSQ